MRRPGWMAGRISLTRSPRPATVASRSSLSRARPQKKAGRSAPPPRSIASGGFLRHLEDDGAEAEEGLARGAGRGRLLAHAAQVEAGSPQRHDRAVEVGGDRDHVIDRSDSVVVSGHLGRRRPLRARRRQPVEVVSVDVA
jgi:hypothetical protein